MRSDGTISGSLNLSSFTKMQLSLTDCCQVALALYKGMTPASYKKLMKQLNNPDETTLWKDFHTYCMFFVRQLIDSLKTEDASLPHVAAVSHCSLGTAAVKAQSQDATAGKAPFSHILTVTLSEALNPMKYVHFVPMHSASASEIGSILQNYDFKTMISDGDSKYDKLAGQLHCEHQIALDTVASKLEAVLRTDPASEQINSMSEKEVHALMQQYTDERNPFFLLLGAQMAISEVLDNEMPQGKSIAGMKRNLKKKRKESAGLFKHTDKMMLMLAEEMAEQNNKGVWKELKGNVWGKIIAFWCNHQSNMKVFLSDMSVEPGFVVGKYSDHIEKVIKKNIKTCSMKPQTVADMCLALSMLATLDSTGALGDIEDYLMSTCEQFQSLMETMHVLQQLKKLG